MENIIINKTMTSREIAEITGKSHDNVLKAIRAMEPAWEKVSGRKFNAVTYNDVKGEERPMYDLTQRECLYIATKFNDEARAKLVLRWEELEMKNLIELNVQIEQKNIQIKQDDESAKQRYSLTNEKRFLDARIESDMKRRREVNIALNHINMEDYRRHAGACLELFDEDDGKGKLPFQFPNKSKLLKVS